VLIATVGDKNTLLQVGFLSGFAGLQMCVLLCVGLSKGKKEKLNGRIENKS
jgi:hypothetical protein